MQSSTPAPAPAPAPALKPATKRPPPPPGLDLELAGITFASSSCRANVCRIMDPTTGQWRKLPAWSRITGPKIHVPDLEARERFGAVLRVLADAIVSGEADIEHEAIGGVANSDVACAFDFIAAELAAAGVTDADASPREPLGPDRIEGWQVRARATALGIRQEFAERLAEMFIAKMDDQPLMDDLQAAYDSRR